MSINRVAVIGSGVMGAGIAAHLANAGVPSLLLDIVLPFGDEDKKAGLTPTDKNFRNKLALRAINEVIPKSKPSLIFDARDTKLVTPGNLEDDLAKIGECDWIVEVVVERLDIKQKVFAQIEKVAKPSAIISSNTSGIPLKAVSEGRGAAFKKNFIITHFFNPVRYMKLVEIVSGPDTDRKVVETMSDFLENRLGKGVVYAKDTPNFVANRIGIYSWLFLVKEMLAKGLTVEEADKICGQPLGRPKSAAFRTADMAGLDTIVHVAKNTYDLCPNDEKREIFKVPDVLNKMVEKKWIGDKTGQGFYKKSKGADGKKEILSLDLATLDYKPQKKVRFDSLGAAKGIDDVGERTRAMIVATDPAGEF